jgi:two-component system cell cycle sensor histidine kinase/response regulator CckA
MDRSTHETNDLSALDQFLGLSLESTRKSYYPQLMKQLNALQESEARFRAYFKSAPVGMAIIDTRRRFKEVNDKLCDILGYPSEEIIGKSFNEFTHPEDREGGRQRWQQLLDGEKMFNQAEKRYIHKDGRVLWTIVTNALLRDDAGQPLYFLSHLMDISEQKRVQNEAALLEQQLQQAQKMQAVGTLAGGVAHDFNNLLMGIQGRTSLMRMDMDSSDPNFDHLKGIEEYIQSASDLTRQLLGFARGGKYEVKSIDLNALVQSSVSMFGRTRKEIRIHTRLEETIPAVEADRRQIEQVLLNLYVNAWQAMPQGGDLFIETQNVALDDGDGRTYQINPGRYVKVSVTDSGMGMDEKVQKRIFEPFFTTKEKARGTGLGLASAYGIVRNHGGIITVYSQIGKGTRFDFYLPVSEKPVQAEPILEKKLHQGTETILLVDDEKLITDVGQAMLEKLGYTVMVAGSGQQAIARVVQSPDRIDLVILDLIMPGMDGENTFEKIREIRPEMPVLLSSGYSIDGQAETVMKKGASAFIQKPYDLYALSEKIRTILDRRRRVGVL